jgi:hypothetical protein
VTREVVKLHTIEQWMATDASVRSVILQNIKLKDRLHRFLYSLNDKKHSISRPNGFDARKCASSPHPGYLLHEPRYDGIHPSAIGSRASRRSTTT